MSLSLAPINGCRLVYLLLGIRHVMCLHDEYVHECVFGIVQMITYVFQKYVLMCVQCVAMTMNTD